jgi:hypothetical protein
MCLAIWLPIWARHFSSWELLALGIGLAAGIRIIFATAEHVIAILVGRLEAVGGEPSLTLKTLQVMTRWPPIRRSMRKYVPIIGALIAGVIIGRNYDDVQRRDNEFGPYSIYVTDKIDNRHAQVMNVNDDGTPQSDLWKLAVCPHELTPSFDAGCTYLIAYELTSTDLGLCESFAGKHAKAKEINCK